MKRHLATFVGGLLLPLVSLASPVVVSATASGSTAAEAVASAKQQVILDAADVGFVIGNGYRGGMARVVEVKRTNQTYTARVDLEISKQNADKKVLILLDGDDQQVAKIALLLDRVRSALADLKAGKEKKLHLLDVKAPSLFNGRSLADVNGVNLESALKQVDGEAKGEAVYLLKKNPDSASHILVKLRDGRSTKRIIRTFRSDSTSDDSSLSDQIASALYADAYGKTATSVQLPPVAIQAHGVTFRKGQRVLIYTPKSNENGVTEAVVLTSGTVREVSGSMVNVSTDLPVDSVTSNTLRISPLSLRGIIKETDW